MPTKQEALQKMKNEARERETVELIKLVVADYHQQLAGPMIENTQALGLVMIDLLVAYMTEQEIVPESFADGFAEYLEKELINPEPEEETKQGLSGMGAIVGAKSGFAIERADGTVEGVVEVGADR